MIRNIQYFSNSNPPACGKDIHFVVSAEFLRAGGTDQTSSWYYVDSNTHRRTKLLILCQLLLLVPRELPTAN